ncbi:ATP-binding cassette sub-family A member 3 [Araneus ventricosus]|uniref:ATP-binding cassette sub-family A member 3 n=1 Tax=Araneus ventricosus TaxID=182803 RepID=A0A4Y2THG9_ARAVE|nr:ATP-binding cassette sub-family A member 3 [Araneus ventricosus]
MQEPARPHPSVSAVAGRMFVPVDSGICCFQRFLQLSFNRVSAVTCCPLGDLMKMMGMTDFTYWSSTFLNYFVIALITVPIITIAYKATLKNGTALLKHSDGGLVFLILLLFMISLILFCMTFSIFFNRAVFAIIVLLVVYILSFTLLSVKLLDPFNESAYFSMSVIGKLGICLFPQTALVTAIFLISSYEASGEGVHWSNISEFALLPEVNLLMVILTMLFSCFLYVFLLWYFDAVWPWQPGVPKPFYFFLTSSYWCGDRPKQQDEIELVQSENNVEFFEAEPSNISRGIVIKNLSKEFRSGLTSKLAVNNVSLNIYQGQITALLGHNGAGKTTTINILTGLFTPTSGGASINGLDILTDTTKARRGLGVCPQHNVLFNTLTVDEHLKIYAAMKGVPWNQLAAEATKALDILKLSDKRYELAKSLSGGMKRKLSLAIAVIGGSKVEYVDYEDEETDCSSDVSEVILNLNTYKPSTSNRLISLTDPKYKQLTPFVAKSSQMRLGLPSTAVVGDRFGVSDRAVDAIASSVLPDVGLITSNNSYLMVDGNKLIREKAKVRKDLEFQALSEAQALPLKGLYFDGRKDSTLVEERVDTKRYSRKAKEESLCLIEYVGSRYITHLSPSFGTAKNRFPRLLSDILKGSEEIFLNFWQLAVTAHLLKPAGNPV